MAHIVEILAPIDLHVHFRDPGFTHKETIDSGLLCAHNAGFCAVCTMANTNPVVDNVETIKYILDKSKDYDCKIYPIAAVTKNLDSVELVDFKELKEAGAVAFSNDGLPILDKNVFEQALKSGNLILSHLEDETKELKWQIEIFEKLVQEGFNPKLHFCHISKKQSVEIIRNAKKRGLKITVETAPHYFIFTKDDVDSTGRFKMNPALGTVDDKKAIIEGILDNTIDCVASDHAPHTDEEKLSDYKDSPNGIVGLDTIFPLTYMTFGLDKAVELLSINPRKILGIQNDKKVKYDLDKEFIIEGAKSPSFCKITPYEGLKMRGVKVD